MTLTKETTPKVKHEWSKNQLKYTRFVPDSVEREYVAFHPDFWEDIHDISDEKGVMPWPMVLEWVFERLQLEQQRLKDSK